MHPKRPHMVQVLSEIASPAVVQETARVVAGVMAGELLAHKVNPEDEAAAVLVLMGLGWRAAVINQCLDAALQRVRETRSQQT